jgi:hypothetical protein
MELFAACLGCRKPNPGNQGSHAPFLKEKGAHAALFGAAWQEIRVRSGRDDSFLQGKCQKRPEE